MRLVRAELLKAVTTRLLLWFAVGLLLFLVLVLSTHIGSDSRVDLSEASTQRSIVEVAGLAAVVAVLLGAVLVTSEYVHGTINQTFLTVPARERLFAAKLAAAMLAGTALAVLADVATVVITELWYAGRGLSFHLGGGTWTPLLGTVAAAALAAGIGTGVGALLRRQSAVILVVLLWLLIGESVIAIVHGASRYAPGHTVAAIVTAHGSGSDTTLSAGAALVVTSLYAAALCVAGVAIASRADVPSGGE